MSAPSAVRATALDRWACPLCLGALRDAHGGAACERCGRPFPRSSAGQLDFRIDAPVHIAIDYHYDPEWGTFPWDRVQVEWPRVPVPPDAEPGAESIEFAMASLIPPVSAPDARSLDLGCGGERQRFARLMRERGYAHEGVDIAGSAPDALADIHLLPFADQSFEVLLTTAVFEHVKNPHLAMLEAARVAREGALFVGTIAFTEPFHISYFHHSPLAAYELLTMAGFVPRTFVLSRRWNAFTAQLAMGFAGLRMPAAVRGLVGGALYGAALAPAAVRALTRMSAAPLRDAAMAFARSHSGSVGFIAERRRRPDESRVLRRATSSPGSAAP